MRRFAGFIGAGMIGAGLALSGATSALAEDVVIRIEAKRGADAARATARTWGAQFDDVVIFPLNDDWFGIALGPMPRESATARLTELKAARNVPADSFLAAAGGRTLTPVTAAGDGGEDGGGDQDGAADGAATGMAAQPSAGSGSASTFPAAGPTGGVQTLPNAQTLPNVRTAEPAAQPAVQPEPAQPAAPPPPEFYLRLQSHADRIQAEAMLATWRETLPEVGLWTLPNGRSVVAFGPMPEATAKAWLAAFRAADAVPRDAFVTPETDLGEIAIAGKRPDLGAPPADDAAPVALPPLEDIQRALRWAGHYDGAIDGKDGPMTQAAIAQEIVRMRASPDRGTAMAELIRRREAWRAEMGLVELRDDHTGLALPAPMDRLQFDRSERALSIYGPKDGSGAALILFSQPGGQQELLDIAGLVTALGWVPAPERLVTRGAITLDGRNDTHIGHAEGQVVDGRAQGFVLIWPISDPQDQHRLAAEISDNLTRFGPAASENAPQEPAIAPAAATPGAGSPDTAAATAAD